MMNHLAQRIQDFLDSHGAKGLARRMFCLRIRWYIWRGRVTNARVVER